MGRYLARRLLNYVVLLFIAISLTYLLAATALNPRSLYLIVNPPLDPVSIEQSLRQRNLSDEVPLLERYWVWLRDIVTHWDWGDSPKGGPVSDEVGRRIGVSLRLITIGSLVGTVVGVALGAWTATRQYKASDRLTTLGSLFILSVPSFVIASVLQVLATKFNNATGVRAFEFVGESGSHGDYFTAGLMDRIQHLILPTLVLILINAAFFSRIQRNLMLDALGSDFVRTARAKGLPPQTVDRRHVLRNALLPVTTIIGLQTGLLLSGAILTETVFAFPGMGSWLRDAIFNRDYPVLQGGILFLAVVFVLVNLVVDVSYAFINPRIRYS